MAGAAGSVNPVRITMSHRNTTGYWKNAKTYIHEMMHGIGLKYHMNQYRCEDGLTNFRQCAIKKYGNRYDVIGTGNSNNYGLGAQPRLRAGWMNKDTEMKVITSNEKNIQIYPHASTVPNVPKIAILKPSNALFTAPNKACGKGITNQAT